MIVISDTTPLRHLVAIGEDQLLPQIYGSVIIPEIVLSELSAGSAPESIRQWLTVVPAWIRVIRRSTTHPISESRLDPGETAAIELAIELDPDFLLIDDRAGREYALKIGLPVIGTLGVLERADALGLLANLPDTVAALESSGFYLSASLRSAVLDRHRLRHR